MFEKKAYTIQMNFEVPESEKRVAEKAEEYFEQLLAEMIDFAEYLDLIYIPFSKHQNVDSKMIVEYRRTFNQYKEQVEGNFKKMLKNSYHAVSLMNEFMTDTTTSELIDSFIDSIKELEKYIDTFVSIFSNLSSPEFRNNLISTIDSIKKKMNQIRQLVTDRILDHIDSNILSKDWAKDYFEEPINERVPMVIQLFRERQKALQELSKK